MNLLGSLLAQSQIVAISALSYGIVYLSLLIVYRSRYKSPRQKVAWAMQIELAAYLIVMGVLHWLNMYGVETGIAWGLAAWFFLFAALATIILYLINKLGSSSRALSPSQARTIE